MFNSRWLNESVVLFRSFYPVSKITPTKVSEKNSEEIVDEFEFIGPPAYSLPLANLEYNKNDSGLGTSSHKVVQGVDITDGTNYHIKFNDNQAMLYAESFMMHLYQLSLLYGAARTYVRYDVNGKPLAVSSKDIDHFATFKNHKLIKERYEFCLMSDEVNVEKKKIYLREKNGCIAYSVFTPNGEIVRDIVIDTIKAPQPFTLEKLNELEHPILAASSKAGHIPNQQLDDPLYRQRFLRVTAVMDRMHEDDGHAGNITNNPKNLSSCLQVFDGDCTFWDATCEAKGPRPNVDSTPISISIRNPKTAFSLCEDNIIHFPNLKLTSAWYRPGLDAPLSSLVSTNPWSKEENELVRKLESKEALEIEFLENIDWMLDLSQRFEHVAKLHIPTEQTIQGKCSGKEFNLIQLYSDKNKEINNECWELLPKITQFQDYMNQSYEQIAEEILVRCMIRNLRFENDKKNFRYHDNEFDLAKLNPQLVINKLNALIKCVDAKKVMEMTLVLQQQSVLFATVKPAAYAREIDPDTAEKMIEKARSIANELFELEKVQGTSKWDMFEEKKKEIKMRKDNQDSNENIIRLDSFCH